MKIRFTYPSSCKAASCRTTAPFALGFAWFLLAGGLPAPGGLVNAWAADAPPAAGAASAGLTDAAGPAGPFLPVAPDGNDADGPAPPLSGTTEPVAANVAASNALEFKGTKPGQPRIVIHLVLSQWYTNCYILVSRAHRAIVIDPADFLEQIPDDPAHGVVGQWKLTGRDTDVLLNVLRAEKLTVAYIINTHGHLDHVSGNTALKAAFPKAEICMAPKDVDASGRPKDSHSFPGGLPRVDHLLKDGEIIRCDDIVLKILYTPGHSPGSISMLCGDWVFSGDTLFYHTVGRTNFHDHSGSWDDELHSIRTRLYTLPPATLVLPGHYGFTTIGEEEANNPWTQAVPPPGGPQ